jgi:hypothetical protein
VSTVSVVVSGVVAIAGVVVPAAVTLVSRGADRQHELEMTRLTARHVRNQRYVDEREKLYIEFLKILVQMGVVVGELKESDTGGGLTSAIEAYRGFVGSDEGPRHIGARTDAFASEEAQPLLVAWMRQHRRLIGLLGDPDAPDRDEILLREAETRTKLVERLRHELIEMGGDPFDRARRANASG